MCAKTSYAVPALEKGLDILEVLAATPTPLTLANLATRLGRNASELFRMCACLEARGYLARAEASGKYVLTLRLYELAHTHSPVDRLLKAAVAPMQDFTDATRESCHLSILSGDGLLVVAQSESPLPIRLSIEVGARFGLLTTASGRLLLAFASSEARARLLARQKEWKSLSAAARLRLEKRLAQIAAAALSTAEDESVIGIRDVVVPIGKPALGVTAALASAGLVSGQRTRAEREILASLRAAAAAITERMGLRYERNQV